MILLFIVFIVVYIVSVIVTDHYIWNYTPWASVWDASSRETVQLLWNDITETATANGATVLPWKATLLGTVRHDGLVPWCDSVDLLVQGTREQCTATLVDLKLLPQRLLLPARDACFRIADSQSWPSITVHTADPVHTVLLGDMLVPHNYHSLLTLWYGSDYMSSCRSSKWTEKLSKRYIHCSTVQKSDPCITAYGHHFQYFVPINK